MIVHNRCSDIRERADVSRPKQNAPVAIAWLNFANLSKADLSKAQLGNANLNNANLTNANLSDTNLENASLNGTFCLSTNFSNANLKSSDLRNAIFVETDLNQAIITDCKVYGLSAWNLKGVPKDQSLLVITPKDEPEITVDDLQVAQFIYLLLNNKNVRNVIDTVTSKAVLILGRFTESRKAILDALFIELRRRNYLPILFDFSGPGSRDITETVSTLAHLAKFVIADITDAKSIPQELQVLVPHLPSVPVLPILLASQSEYGMFEHFKRYPWVLPTFYYEDIPDIISSLNERILHPLELKVNELSTR